MMAADPPLRSARRHEAGEFGDNAVAASERSGCLPFRIGFDGVAPVRVGMTVAQVERALHAKLSIEFPNGDGPDGCGEASARGREESLAYMFERGRVTRVDLAGARSPVRTATGIGLGSSIADIRRAYGTAARAQTDVYSEEPDFEVKSPDRKAAIVFETEHGKVVRIHAGQLPSAEYIEGCDRPSQLGFSRAGSLG